MEIEFERNGLAILHPSEFFSGSHPTLRQDHQQDLSSSGNAGMEPDINERQLRNNGLAKLMEAVYQVVHAIKEYAPDTGNDQIIDWSRRRSNSPFPPTNHPPPSERPRIAETRASTPIKHPVAVPELKELVRTLHAPRAFSVIGSHSFYGGSPRSTTRSSNRPALSPLTPPNSSPIGLRFPFRYASLDHPQSLAHRDLRRQQQYKPVFAPVDRYIEAARTPECIQLGVLSGQSGVPQPPLEAHSPNNDPTHTGTVSSLLAVVIPPRPSSNGEMTRSREFPPPESEYDPAPESDKEDNDSSSESVSFLVEQKGLHEIDQTKDEKGLKRRRASKPTLNEEHGRLAAIINSSATRGRAQAINLNYGPTDEELRCFPVTDCSTTVARAKAYPKHLRACDEHLLEVGKLPDPDDRHQEAPYVFGASGGQLLAEYRYLSLRVGVNGEFAWSNRVIKRLLRRISYEMAMDVADFRRKMRKRLRRGKGARRH